MKLSRIDGNHHLSPYGAGSYDRMQDDGMPEGGITSSWRDPEEQKQLFLSRYRRQLTGRGPFNDVRWWRAVRYVRHSPLGPVAVPGTSLHEKGLALDMSTSSAAHKWMLKNARKHGWRRTLWDAYQLEPWHWEYNRKLDTQKNRKDWFNMATKKDLEDVIREFFMNNQDYRKRDMERMSVVVSQRTIAPEGDRGLWNNWFGGNLINYLKDLRVRNQLKSIIREVLEEMEK